MRRTRLGFLGIRIFEGDYGDPNTVTPYYRVTPSQSSTYDILPFRCPHCQKVVTEFATSDGRSKYLDDRPGHANYWCPKCDKRYFMNFGGPVFSGAVYPGEAAPSKVEMFRPDGSGQVARSFMQDERGPGLSPTYAAGLDILGVGYRRIA
jgi:hypothetical protein